MGVDLLSPVWKSNAELIKWKETVDPILAGLSLAVCVIAQILFYMFPRLRVFPRSILSWVNWYNITYMITLIIKWSPYSVLHYSWVINLSPGSLLCKAGIIMDNANLLGSVACTLLLCLTMFLSVVMRINIEGKPIYFWGYLVFATIFPVVLPFIAIYLFSSKTAFGVCIIGSEAAAMMIKVTVGVLFGGQLLLLISTMIYIKRAFSNVHGTTTTNFPMSYLIIRFIAMFLAQSFELIPNAIAVSIVSGSLSSNAIFNRLVTVSRLFGPVPDALVLILGNTDFMEWVKKQYAKRFGKSQSISQTTTIEIELAPKSPKLGESIDMSASDELLERTHLSTSIGNMGHSTPKHLSIAVEGISIEGQDSSDVSEGIK